MGELPASKVLQASRNQDPSKLDLRTFVDNINYLRHVLQPILIIKDWVMSCYRWHHPKATSFLLFAMNGIWFQSTHFSLITTTIFFWALFTFIGFKTEILSKSLPDSCPVVSSKTKSDIYQDYFKSISQINSIALELSNFITSCYKVIRWDDFHQSLTAYANFFLYASIIYLSFTYSVMILVNALLFQNLLKSLVPLVVEKWRSFCRQEVEVNASEVLLSAPAEETSTFPDPESLSRGHGDVEHHEESEEAQQDADDVCGTVAATDDNSSRICNGCDSSYGYILNRRNYCRHCGDHYCGSCCNQQVPRSFFGATAPAAKTETVTVCRRCFEYLTEKFEKPTSAEDKGKQVSKIQTSIN